LHQKNAGLYIASILSIAFFLVFVMNYFSPAMLKVAVELV
tara:strand:- start:201 stop:320 length:120 start_codon:yes stop_codon:yes gene_type:complete